MDFSAFSQQLQELATRYRKEVSTQIGKQEDVSRELSSFLDEHYNLYYTATPEECQKLREAIGINREFEDFLLSYAQDIANRIQSAGDVALLKSGLVALSLENCGRDLRDTLITLADLYVSTESAGIDPKPVFMEAAAISSKERPRGGSTPVSELLENIHTYPVVQEGRSRGKNFWE